MLRLFFIYTNLSEYSEMTTLQYTGDIPIVNATEQFISNLLLFILADTQSLEGTFIHHSKFRVVFPHTSSLNSLGH